MSPARSQAINYLVGFVQALILTLVAFYITVDQSMSMKHIILSLAVLAIVQLSVQLTFFFHFGHGVTSRAKLYSFIFMSLILLIIVIGSIWIMNHLNYNMIHMSPTEKELYLTTQKDKGF